MNELEIMRARVQRLEDFVSNFAKTDRYSFSKHIEIFDGKNIRLGTANGTKFGTSATELLGFYGATPIAQQGTRPVTVAGVTADLAKWGFYP